MLAEVTENGEVGVFGRNNENQSLTLLAFPRAAAFLLLSPLGPTPESTAAAPPVICDPGPPRRFLFSLVADGGAKLPTGVILTSGLGVCTWACCIPTL